MKPEDLPPINQTIDTRVHRYEIWALTVEGQTAPFCIGWSNDPHAFDQAIAAHPSWDKPLVRDRHELAPETCNCPECRTIHGDPSAPKPQGEIRP